MYFIWGIARQKNGKYFEIHHEYYYGMLLETQMLVFFSTFILSVMLQIRVMTRLYCSFDCLRFHWSTVIYCVIGVVLFMAFPLFLFWAYLKHGVLNMPAVHVVVRK